MDAKQSLESPAPPEGGSFEQQKNVPAKRKRIFLFTLLALIGLGVAGFLFWQWQFGGGEKPAYTQTYRLVPEKVSQSAAIPVSLPPGTDRETARENISFEPAIEGEWVDQPQQKTSWIPFLKTANAAGDTLSDEPAVLLFKSKEDLKLNRYYAVQLANFEGGVIKADFLAVENPAIVAVFPKEQSEAPEDSEITIVFSRPMVPLTTLGELEEKDIPVEITPATQGKFKWITTRNLQFIPAERLVRSSRYTVKIKEGFVSMDGLPLAGGEYQFTSRQLRYVRGSGGEQMFNRPISLHFNQPIDLGRTLSEISVRDNKTGQTVPFVAEFEKPGGGDGLFSSSLDIGLQRFFAQVRGTFGLTLFGNPQVGSTDGNGAVLWIYKQSDRFGRKKLWDFEGSYTVRVNKVYPAEGDIILDKSIQASVSIPTIIRQITAESERTSDVNQDFFDPQGKIWISFYEDIDLGRSDLEIPKSKEIGYGEKCADSAIQFSSNVQCEKVPDKSRVFVLFESSQVGLGEQIQIRFDKVVNTEGLELNKEPFTRTITAYPAFQVLGSFPGNGDSNTSLVEFTFCTNTPLNPPTKEELEQYIKANLPFELQGWERSWKVTRVFSQTKCNMGEFETRITYGLMPQEQYRLEFSLSDVFGQRQDYSLAIATGPMPSSQLGLYHLQAGYNVTPPSKTKLTYAAKNMEFVNLEICKLSPRNFLYYLENEPAGYESSGAAASCEQVVQNTISLPKRFWLKNYFTVDIRDYMPDPIGHYVVTLTHPAYQKNFWINGGNVLRTAYERTFVSVTNLAAAEKRIQPQVANFGSGGKPLSQKELQALQNIYWVSNTSTLDPVPGAQVQLYQGRNLALAGSATTNEQGVAFAAVVSNISGAVITSGADSTVIPSSESKVDYASIASSAERIYLYTDKPLYQPGQEIFIKGIDRVGYDGNYEILEGETVSVQVFNSKQDEIFNRKLLLNGFGTFDTKVFLEANAPLGSYRICAQEYACISVDVQQYVPAAFEVTLQPDKEEYISKDTVKLNVDANYYFGVPVEAGEVTYTVSSQNYYFDRFSDEYFSFGTQSYYEYPFSYGDKFLLRGTTSLTAGKAEIQQLLDLGELLGDEAGRGKLIIFDVTLQTADGKSVSAQKSFVAHPGELYLGVRADRSFVGKNQDIPLRVKSVDTQGKEVGVGDAKMTIYRLEWVYAKRQGTGGGYSYTWERKKEQVQQYDFRTDGDGNYSKTIQLAKEGQYEVEVSTTDRRGNAIQAATNVYVYGEGSVSVQPTQGISLELEPKETNLSVGDTGEIVIKSPYERAKAFIAIERGKVFEYEIKDIRGNLSNFTFQVQEQYAPNVFVSVLLQSPDPEIKFGQVEFRVGAERKELHIEVKADQTHYLPGEEVRLDIVAKDSLDQPVETEVSLAVVDLSVLALKGNPKKNPLVFFYGGFPLTVTTSSNIKNVLVEAELSATKGGGGGASQEDLATKARGDFREVAFWQARANTDRNGKATLTFTLPDNLTRWQAESVGVTKDTKVGVGYSEFTTQKDVMLVPLRPRFVVPGDIFMVGAKVFNQTEQRQNLEVSFESETLVSQDNKTRTNMSLDKGETTTLYFAVRAPESMEQGEHRFVLSAKNNAYEDTVIQTIPISANHTYEVTATANYTADEVSKEYVFLPDNIVREKGDLSVQQSATLAVFLSDALQYLVQYPYGCSEQVSSKLNAIAIIKRGLNLPNLGDKFQLQNITYGDREYSPEELIEIGLAELMNNQTPDGGFSLWRDGEPSFYATLPVVETLRNLSAAGVPINEDSLRRAAEYLYREVTSNNRIYQNRNNVILAAYELFQLPAWSNNTVLRQRITTIASDDLFINDQISNGALAQLALILHEGNFPDNLEQKIYNTLDNRIDIDARGTFLESNSNFLWYYYETPIKNTALYLKAKVAREGDVAVIDKVIRWLLNSRAKDGAWGSTNNTITVIDAFTDFLQWKRETESDFTLELLVNGLSKDRFRFQAETILDQRQTTIPLSELKVGSNNGMEFSKTSHNNLSNSYYYDAALKYFLPAAQIPPRDEGMSIVRTLHQLDDQKNENPLSKAKVGDVLRVHLQLTVPKSRNFVTVEDFIPAGFEIVNLDLATEQKSLRLQETELVGRQLYVDHKELRHDRAFLYTESLGPGVYEFDYFIRALVPGTFTHLPAVASEMYFPEVFGRTPGGNFQIEQ